MKLMQTQHTPRLWKLIAIFTLAGIGVATAGNFSALLAKGTPSAPAPAPVPASVATTAPTVATAPTLENPSINILILVIDSLRSPADRSGPPAKPLAETSVVTPAAVMPPVKDSSDGRAPAITPTQPVGQPGAPRPTVRQEAKKVPPAAPAAEDSGAAITPAALPRITKPGIEIRAYAKKKMDKEELDKLFNTDPLPPGVIRPGVQPIPGATAPAVGPGSSPPVVGVQPAPDSLGGDIGTPIKPPSAAQSAAVNLRRALAGAGYKDVITASFDSPVIERPLNARRLTTRVLDTAAQSVSDIARLMAKAPAPTAAAGGASAPAGTPAAVNDFGGARQPAIQAASRIGQIAGYRAVIVLAVATPDPTTTAGAAAVSGAPLQQASYTLVLADAARETGEVMAFDAAGADEKSMHEEAATIGSTLLTRSLRDFPEFSTGARLLASDKHLEKARELMAAGSDSEAEDELNQAFALNTASPEIYELMGDLLQKKDPAAAVDNFKNAAALKVNDGKLWTKLAVAHTLTPKPDWISAINAARRAISLKSDSPLVQLILARSQFGRAAAFRALDRIDLAEDAEETAKRHLDSVMAQAKDADQDIKDQASRMIASHLVTQGRHREAVEMLETLIHVYPKDVELLRLYATSLTSLGKRDEDAFVAWLRVWQQTENPEVRLDVTQYKRLANGFDIRLHNIARQTTQLTTGVASGTVARANALLQLQRYQQDMNDAVGALKLMVPPAGPNSAEIHQMRSLAGALMVQSLSFYEEYLDVGEDRRRMNGLAGQRQAIDHLNAARNMNM